MSLALQVVAPGAAQRTAMPLEATGAATITIGSLASNQLVLLGAGIEPIHALLDRGDDGDWRLTDLGTLAGVKVNGTSIAIEHRLAPGDVIEIGGARLMIHARAIASVPPPADAALSRLFYHPRRSPKGGRHLEVVAYWGDTVLNIDHFHPSLKGFESVTIGDPTKAHFISGGHELFKTAVLADVDDRQSTLRLVEGMVAHVRQDGKTRKLEGQQKLRLGHRDYAHVEFGAVRYFLHWADQPRVELPRNKQRDMLFTSLAISGALLYLMLVTIALTITPKPLPDAKDDEIWDPRYVEQPHLTKRDPIRIADIPEPKRPITSVVPKKQPVREPKPVKPVEPPKKPATEIVQVKPKPEIVKPALAKQDPVPVTKPAMPQPAAAKPSAVKTPSMTLAANPRFTPAPAGSLRPNRPAGNSGGPGMRTPASAAPSRGPGTPNAGVEGGRNASPSTIDLKRLSNTGFGPVASRDGPGAIHVDFASTSGSQGRPGGGGQRHSVGQVGDSKGFDIPGTGGRVGDWGNGPGGVLGSGGKGPGGNALERAFASNGPGGPAGVGSHSPANVTLPADPVMNSSGLSSEDVQRVFRANLNQIRHCYNQLLQRQPNAAGKFVVAFAIGLDGRVQRPTVRQDTINDSMTRGCIIGVVSRWSFPRPRGSSAVDVTYPFSFAPM